MPKTHFASYRYNKDIPSPLCGSRGGTTIKLANKNSEVDCENCSYLLRVSGFDGNCPICGPRKFYLEFPDDKCDTCYCSNCKIIFKME